MDRFYNVLGYPVGLDLQCLGLLCRIVRFERNLKQVLAAHPFVHHEIGIERRGLAGLQGRLTDDHLARSTPLHNASEFRNI